MASSPTHPQSRGGDSHAALSPISHDRSKYRHRSRDRHRTQWKEIRALVKGVLAGSLVVAAVLLLGNWLQQSLQDTYGTSFFGDVDHRTGHVTVAQFSNDPPAGDASQATPQPVAPNLGFRTGPLPEASPSLAFILRMQRNAIHELLDERDNLLQAAEAQAKRSEQRPELAHITDRSNFTAIAKPGTWRQRFIAKQGPFAFVAFSSHRLSSHVFAILGQAVPIIQVNGSFDWCAWIFPNGTRQYGHLELIMRKTKPLPPINQYSTAQLRCNLSRVPEGRYQPPEERPGVPSPSVGGILQVFFNNVIFYPYREEPGTTVVALGDKFPLRHKIVFCSAPMRMRMDATVFMQWLSYHRYYVGYDYYHLYDAGTLGRQIRVALAKYVESKLVTITDFRAAFRMSRFDPQAVLAENSCLLSHHDDAEWVALGAVDEYLRAKPGQTVKGVLAQNPDSAAISHGEYRFSTQRCQNSWDPETKGTRFIVEQLHERGAEPVCWKGGNLDNVDMCVKYFGRRKLILNPRKVLYTLPYDVVEGEGSVTDLPAPELNHAYYNKLMMWGYACTNGSEDGPRGGKWVVDDLTAQIAAKARVCALGDFKGEGCTPA